jgi:hypothetical protein
MRIGQMSAALEKAEAHGGQICLPSGGKSKADALAEAGISTSAAHRYEELAGCRALDRFIAQALRHARS